MALGEYGPAAVGPAEAGGGAEATVMAAGGPGGPGPAPGAFSGFRRSPRAGFRPQGTVHSAGSGSSHDVGFLAL